MRQCKFWLPATQFHYFEIKLQTSLKRNLKSTIQSINSDVPFYLKIFPCSAGPVSGVVTSYFNCRVTVMLGGVMLAGGLVISSFASSIMELLFKFGLISGKFANWSNNSSAVGRSMSLIKSTFHCDLYYYIIHKRITSRML